MTKEIQNIPLNFFKIAGGILLTLWVLLGAAALFFECRYKIEKEYVPFKIHTRKSYFIQEGWLVWLKEGEKGYKKTGNKVFSLSGIELKKVKYYETALIKKPKEGFVVKGYSKKKNPIAVPPVTYMHYTHDMEATAYDPSPESNSVEWAGITALGWKTRYGIAAVDPKVIALRSLIYVENYGFAWAGDVGGAIKGKRIDLCYNTTTEAMNWGRRKAKVYVLGTKPQSYYQMKKQKAEQAKKIK